jgi:hypothetical protein
MVALISMVLPSRLGFKRERRDNDRCLPIHIDEQTWSFGLSHSFRVKFHSMCGCNITTLVESPVVLRERPYQYMPQDDAGTNYIHHQDLD